MNLQQTQELFWQAARNEATPDAIRACFQGDARLSAIGRMKIYSGAFFSRQTSALSQFLPKTEKLLRGEFSRLSREYILRFPGVAAPLESLPQYFAAFLEQQGGRAQAAAVARLELARNRALLAPEEEAPLTLAGMQACSPSSGLRAAQHVQVAHSTEGAFRIFREQEEQSSGRPSQEDESIWVLFFRKNFIVRHRVLEQDEIHTLELLCSGTTLSALCESFLDAPSPSQRVHEVLSRLLNDEVLLCDPTSPQLIESDKI